MSTDTSEKAGRYSSCAHSCAVCGEADMLHLTDLERENLHLEAELRRMRVPLRVAAVEIPIRTTNPNNGRHGRWQAQHGKRSAERERVGRYLLGMRSPKVLRVTLTRFSPNEMDEGGLLAALKSTQDAIASRLGVDDGPRGPVEWVFRQAKGERGKPMVRVEVETISPVAGRP